jgi:hypothetical protein
VGKNLGFFHFQVISPAYLKSSYLCHHNKNMNHKKIIKSFPVNYQLYWSYGVSIADIRRDLVIIENMGATHVDIRPDDYYGALRVIFEVTCQREETDEEFKERIVKEKQLQKEEEEREMAEFERLRTKYAGKIYHSTTDQNL